MRVPLLNVSQRERQVDLRVALNVAVVERLDTLQHQSEVAVRLEDLGELVGDRVEVVDAVGAVRRDELVVRRRNDDLDAAIDDARGVLGQLRHL